MRSPRPTRVRAVARVLVALARVQPGVEQRQLDVLERRGAREQDHLLEILLGNR